MEIIYEQYSIDSLEMELNLLKEARSRISPRNGMPRVFELEGKIHKINSVIATKKLNLLSK